jgi:hypothetical protein
MKEELNNDYGKPQKKYQTEILEIKRSFSQTKNKVDGHTRRIEHVEDTCSQSLNIK